jgi:rubrerythrin
MALEVDFSKMDGRDALDISIVIEDEAQLAYEHLAEWVASDGNKEAAEFFSRMAVREKRHKTEIGDRRRELYGDAPVRHDEDAPWQAEVPDYESLGKNVSLEEAFNVAMGAETRAHDFYADAIDYIEDEAVVELFDWLRKAEIEHQRMLNEEMERHLK